MTTIGVGIRRRPARGVGGYLTVTDVTSRIGYVSHVRTGEIRDVSVRSATRKTGRNG